MLDMLLQKRFFVFHPRSLFSPLLYWWSCEFHKGHVHITSGTRGTVYNHAKNHSKTLPAVHHIRLSHDLWCHVQQLYSDVCSGPQRLKSLFVRAGKIIVWTVSETMVKAQLMSSLTALMYVSKAGSLLQGGVQFSFLVNHWISSLLLSDSRKNSFNWSRLKICSISYSNWNLSNFDGFG